MKIAITGSQGLIGRVLVACCPAAGHEVVTLVRDPAEATSPDRCWWDPARGIQQPEKLHGIQAVVHLAGRSIADHRWTAAEKDRLRESRVAATASLCRDLARLPHPPQVFLSASAVGFYGDCGGELVDEQTPAGSGFLAEMAQAWENASEILDSVGTRRVLARFGIVLSAQGGALAKMLPIFRWGLGANLGHGQQYWSWITRPDATRALLGLLESDQARGPYNIVSPTPVTNAEFTRTLARVLHRPRCLPVPAWVLRLLMGEMADAALLASCRAVPSRLLALGCDFQHRELEPALLDALAAKQSHAAAG